MESTKGLKVFYEETLKPTLASLESERKKIKGFTIYGGIGIGALIVMFLSLRTEIAPINGYTIGFTAAPLIVVAVFFIKAYDLKNDYRKKYKYTVVKKLVKYLDPNWRYYPYKKIIRIDVAKTDL